MTKNSSTESDSPLGSMPDTSSSAYAQRSAVLSLFDRFASRVTRWAGSPAAFCMALGVVVVWAALGPVFQYSEDWQLVINTGTTIVTFLMVFLIQSTQSRDTQALHLKLDELIRVDRSARNYLLNLEEMSEAEVEEVKRTFERLMVHGEPAADRQGTGDDELAAPQQL